MALQIWLPLTKNSLNYGVHPSNVTVSNATQNANGKLGGCYSFNGTSSHIYGTQTVITNNTDNWSFACWMRLNVVNTTQTLFSCRNSVNPNGITIFYSNGYWLIDDGVRWQPTNALSANTWYHVCIIRKKDVGKYLYINGALVSSTTTVGTQTTVNSANFAIGLCHQSASAFSGNPLNGYLNDVRFYDHALSPIEVTGIAKGLCVHYKLDTPSSISNLVRNTSYNVYNNYASAGFAATLTNTGRTYNSCKIYRLTYTPGSDTTKLNNVKSSLTNHGIYGFGRTFLANTKYCFWILCKPISHPDTVVGGTASNISGWTEIPMKKYSDDWFIVGQCRKGNVTENKTDSIYTSFKTPSAEAGVPITIDFCCPHLIEGSDSILPEYDYVGTDPGIVDSSGYSNHGTKNGTLSPSIDTPRYSMSTNFPENSSTVTITPYLTNNQTLTEISVSCWYKTNTLNSTAPNLWSLGENSFLRLRLASTTSIWYYARVGSTQKGYTYTAGKTLTDNAWHHVVLTFKNGVFVVYVDGSQIGTSDASGTATYLTCANTAWHLAGYTANSENFIGNLSDFRIYTTCLSTDDVLRLYNTAASVAKTGAMLGYEMKEG